MLNQKDSLLLVVDIQEKLVNMLKNEDIKNDFFKISKAANLLDIKTIVSEQYPKGLGKTIKEVKENLSDNALFFEKTSFSAIKEEKILEEIEKSNKKQVVLFGIEAHICVFQTALELKEKGYEVFVVSDLSYSRNDKEKELAMKNLRHKGIMTLSLEMVLFMWLGGSKNPNFKEVQALIK